MQVGDIVEDFSLPDQDGNTVHLFGVAGKPVVLFFYPRANTPGCTLEACGFQSELTHFKALQGKGVVVLGISRDTVKAQKKFAEKYGLQYPLLADADQTICNRFGVIKEKNMYGKKVTGIERTTFVIGPDHRLMHIFAKVKPEGHAEEVLALLKK